MNEENRKQPVLTSLFVWSMLSLALSLLLPPSINWAPGLAGATAATLTFLGLYLVAFSLSLYLLGLTLISMKRLGNWQRIQGLTPFLLVAAVGGGLLSLLE